MATYYFRDTVDTDWDNGNNWWDAPSGGTNGSVPTSSDDAVIKALVDTASIANAANISNMTIDSGGVVTLAVTVSGQCTVQNGGRLAGSLYGSVVCTTGGIIGYASNFFGAGIYGLLTFESSGSTDADSGYGIYVSSDTVFYSNWTGSASYITAANFNYYYGYSGTTSDLTTSGYALYHNYPTLYYNNANSDGDWAVNLNWWVDSGYTQQAASPPTSSTTVYVNANVTTDSSSSATADTAYFNGNITIYINLIVINDATFYDANYGDGSSSVTLTANNVYFDSPYAYGVSNYAYISFANECRFMGGTTNAGSVSANGTGTGSTFFDDGSSNTGTVGVGATSYTVDFSDSSVNTGTVNINTNANYPLNRNTFNTGTINGSINYVGYPSNFYFYGGNDWNNTSYWWTIPFGMGDNAAYIPGVFDSVVIQTAPSSTANDIYVDNMTIDGAGFILANNSYTVYVTYLLTVDNGSIGDGMTGTNISSASATFNNTSSIWTLSNLTVSSGCSFNGSSDINGGSVTGEVYFYGTSTFTSGTITGNAIVYYPHPAPLVVGGTITGSLSYSGYPNRTVYYNGAVDSSWTTAGNWWNDDTHSIPAAYAPDSAISLDNVVINGNITSGASPTPTVNSMLVKGSADVSIDIICDTATFEDNSTFNYYNHTYYNPQSVLTQVNAGTVSITFSELSGNYGTIYVADWSGTYNPPVVFEDGAYVAGAGIIYGNVHIYYPVSLPYDMTIYGAVTYFGYPFYFNDSAGVSPSNDGDWNNPNNWYLDSFNSVSANSTPSEVYPGDNVTLQTSVTTTTGGSPTAYNLSCGSNSSLSITNAGITVNGLATFENDGTLGSGASINGDALFKDTSTCEDGTVTLTATFTLSSAAEMIYNGYNGTYGSSATDVQFQYGKGVNGSSILGLV